MSGADKPEILRMLQSTPEFEPEEVVVAEEVIDDYLNDPVNSGYSILVAEIDTSPVGYICYGPIPMTRGSWDMYWLAVNSAQQTRGIGKALVLSAEEDITARKGRLILIETSSQPGYEKTRRFHKARGYDIICRIADFYAPGDDKVLFQKRLS